MSYSHLVRLFEEYLLEKDSTPLGRAIATMKANCLDNILEASKGETRDALQANKYLLEFNPKEESKRGRPSKDDILSEARKIAEDTTRVEEDLARLKEHFDAVHESR